MCQQRGSKSSLKTSLGALLCLTWPMSVQGNGIISRLLCKSQCNIPLSQSALDTFWVKPCGRPGRYNHQVLYDVLLMRRPTKALDLGNGFILLNPIVMA